MSLSLSLVSTLPVAWTSVSSVTAATSPWATGPSLLPVMVTTRLAWLVSAPLACTSVTV